VTWHVVGFFFGVLVAAGGSRDLARGVGEVFFFFFELGPSAPPRNRRWLRVGELSGANSYKRELASESVFRL